MTARPDTPSECAADTVYYNGSCPVCRMEIDHYRRLAERNDVAVQWIDVSHEVGNATSPFTDAEAPLRRLHVRNDQGDFVSGIDAFVAIWTAIPRFRFLARLIQWRPARLVTSFVYERGVAPALFAWHQRRQRRRANHG